VPAPGALQRRRGTSVCGGGHSLAPGTHSQARPAQTAVGDRTAVLVVTARQCIAPAGPGVGASTVARPRNPGPHMVCRVSRLALMSVVRPVVDPWMHQGCTTPRQRGCFEAVSGRHCRSAGVWGSAPPGTRTTNPLIKKRRNYLLHHVPQCHEIPFIAGPAISPSAWMLGRAALCWQVSEPMDAPWTHIVVANTPPAQLMPA
jgi:hypothetical protein